MENDNNVIPFRNDYPLFNHQLRRRLEEGIKDRAQDPKSTVDTFENVLCSYIISSVRQVVSKLASKAGDSMVRKIIGG